MKSKLLLLAFALSAFWANAQCGYDSIGGGGGGIAAIDTLHIGTIAPRCPACPCDSCDARTIPSGFNGDIYAYSPNNATVTVQITTGCNLLLWDTCVTLQPRSGGTVLLKRFSVLGDAQVAFCGLEGDIIELDCKIAGNAKELLDSVLLDMTICDSTTSVLEPFNESQYIYIDAKTFIEAQPRELKPYPTLYIKRKRRPK